MAQEQAESQGHWTQQMASEHEDLLSRLGRDLVSVSIDRSNKDSMVYYDRETLLASWGEVLEVVRVVEEAYDIQTAIVLRKSLGGHRRRALRPGIALSLSG